MCDWDYYSTLLNKKDEAMCVYPWADALIHMIHFILKKIDDTLYPCSEKHTSMEQDLGLSRKHPGLGVIPHSSLVKKHICKLLRWKDFFDFPQILCIFCVFRSLNKKITTEAPAIKNPPRIVNSEENIDIRRAAALVIANASSDTLNLARVLSQGRYAVWDGWLGRFLKICEHLTVWEGDSTV